MFTSFALLLPFCMCVLGTLLFFFKRHKPTSQRLMLAMNVLCMVYFFADTLLIGQQTGWMATVAFSAVRQTVGPMLPPMLLLVVRSMMRENYYSWTTGFWFLPPVMLGSVCFVLYLLMGVDNASTYMAQLNTPDGPQGLFASDSTYQLHYTFSRYIFTGVMLAELLYVTIYLIYNTRATGYTVPAMRRVLRTGGSVPIVNLLTPVLVAFLLVAGLRIGLGQSYLFAHNGIAATLNVLLACIILSINYLALYANRSPVTLRNLRSPLSSADSSKKYHYAAEHEKKDTPIEGMSALSYAELVDGFRALIMVERIHLQSTVSVEDVAIRLHSNRTYVSCMISKEYGMSFRDYINSLRMESAKRYMKEKPNATQEEVAQYCGYSSASTFNKKFRQIVGQSPRQWLIAN